ncbi:hypothetical protein [Clostridium manihotivorum]|uniref:Uncharacterized protein n=1 Tax=Clostridium manihotivorum TaxID=2320868 RepID=A0A3R5QW76_9CLOT|nr:hypothetical protein [Clostridium manihotivorum]QAA30956.1 hypothetical protein C1I91_04340 [Clostridium manihotivorum]
MLDIVKIGILLPLIFIASVIAVKFSKCGRSTQDATKICLGFLKDVFKELSAHSHPIKPNYPVAIGFDGRDINFDLVDASFHEISKYFEVLYCCNFRFYSNRIVYYFKFANLNTDLEYLDFLKLIERISEKILIQHLRNQQKFIPCDNFICSNIYQDTLQLSIALNDIGIKETKYLRNWVKHNYHASKEKQDVQDIDIDWDDKKDE